MISRTKKKDKPDKEHMSRQYRVWKDFLQTALDRTMPLTHHYVLLHTANLIGLFTCVFVKKEELTNISNIGSTDVKRGMGGLHGNKVCYIDWTLIRANPLPGCANTPFPLLRHLNLLDQLSLGCRTDTYEYTQWRHCRHSRIKQPARRAEPGCAYRPFHRRRRWNYDP